MTEQGTKSEHASVRLAGMAVILSAYAGVGLGTLAVSQFGLSPGTGIGRFLAPAAVLMMLQWLLGRSSRSISAAAPAAGSAAAVMLAIGLLMVVAEALGSGGLAWIALAGWWSAPGVLALRWLVEPWD